MPSAQLLTHLFPPTCNFSFLSTFNSQMKSLVVGWCDYLDLLCDVYGQCIVKRYEVIPLTLVSRSDHDIELNTFMSISPPVWRKALIWNVACLVPPQMMPDPMSYFTTLWFARVYLQFLCLYFSQAENLPSVPWYPFPNDFHLPLKQQESSVPATFWQPRV